MMLVWRLSLSEVRYAYAAFDILSGLKAEDSPCQITRPLTKRVIWHGVVDASQTRPMAGGLHAL